MLNGSSDIGTCSGGGNEKVYSEREKQKSSVDFLTEFVRRVCDARANRRSISTVSMKSVNRLERVRFFALLIYSIPMFTINY